MSSASAHGSKELAMKDAPASRGGSSGSGKTGVTGSARLYPKGKEPNMTPDFNPMNDTPSTYGLCGTGKD